MASDAGADRSLWDEPASAVLARLIKRPDLPPGFERWQLSLAPNTRRRARPDDWAGALVLVDDGQLEVDCGAHGHHVFTGGDLLVLGQLPLRSLHNPGDESVRLVAVRRQSEQPPAGLLRVIRHIRR